MLAPRLYTDAKMTDVQTEIPVRWDPEPRWARSDRDHRCSGAELRSSFRTAGYPAMVVFGDSRCPSDTDIDHALEAISHDEPYFWLYGFGGDNPRNDRLGNSADRRFAGTQGNSR